MLQAIAYKADVGIRLIPNSEKMKEFGTKLGELMIRRTKENLEGPNKA